MSKTKHPPDGFIPHKNEELWDSLVEQGFHLNPKKLEMGYRSMCTELKHVRKNMQALTEEMLNNHGDVKLHPKTYMDEISRAQRALEKADSQLGMLWNPDNINPLALAGVLTNPKLMKKIESLQEFRDQLNDHLKPLADRLEETRERVEKLITISKALLDPKDFIPIITRGQIAMPGKALTQAIVGQKN